MTSTLRTGFRVSHAEPLSVIACSNKFNFCRGWAPPVIRSNDAGVDAHPPKRLLLGMVVSFVKGIEYGTGPSAAPQDDTDYV
jgi:hypothetical protein